MADRRSCFERRSIRYFASFKEELQGKAIFGEAIVKKEKTSARPPEIIAVRQRVCQSACKQRPGFDEWIVRCLPGCLLIYLALILVTHGSQFTRRATAPLPTRLSNLNGVILCRCLILCQLEVGVRDSLV